jgi:hypothetical protein
MPGTDHQHHLTPGEISGFLGADLVPEARHRVESHLDECAVCRDEVVAVSGLTHSIPVPVAVRRARRRPFLIGGALAAGLAALFLLRPAPSAPTSTSQPVRTPELGEGRVRLEIVSPHPDSAVRADQVSFTWKGSTAGLYRITVLTESGEPVWTAETEDTVIALPGSISLVPARTYFWQVAGIADGIVATTGYQSLRVRP